jgi:hypothetical protein
MSCQANLGPIQTEYTFLGYYPPIPGISCSNNTLPGGPSPGESNWPNTDCSDFTKNCKGPCNKIKVKTKSCENTRVVSSTSYQGQYVFSF